MIYCIYRLLGEATTLPINEMYLVQVYELNNIIRKMDPEWKIDLPYLLFKAIRKNANIEQVLWASVYFFVKGDRSKFRELLDLSNGDHSTLDQFSARYEDVNKRGVEWTCDNYENMVSNKIHYRNWWNYVKNHCKDIHVLTVDEMKDYLTKLGPDIDIIDEMYRFVLPSILLKLTGTDELEPEHVRNNRAFKRWQIGNLLLFFRYDFFEDVRDILDKILDNLTKLDETGKVINETIGLYQQALKVGLSLNKIDPDDYFTFCGTYPMIDNNVLEENNDKRTLKEYLTDYGLLVSTSA